MNSSEKGDKLEDAFYQYLVDQQQAGELVFGVGQPDNFKIYRKKKYYCKVREAYVEFDVVIEIYRAGRPSPHSYVIFECKNYSGSISEVYVNDFTAKIGRLFPNAAKGIMVVSSQLQSGAEQVARNHKIGIVKYDVHGFDIIADRQSPSYLEVSFVKSQFLTADKPAKPLKFSAYYDGEFFGTIDQFLMGLDPNRTIRLERDKKSPSVPFITDDKIKTCAQQILNKIEYEGGRVDLNKICVMLSIDLHYSNQTVQNAVGAPILGSANFNHNIITINVNRNEQQGRFTLAHEIGHFCLGHVKYLSSESIIEMDILLDKERKPFFNYERLELQANIFSSNLLIPDTYFKYKVKNYRDEFDIRNRGHGYIFVDDQPINLTLYHQLMIRLSNHFDVSIAALEFKLLEFEMLNDQRSKFRKASFLHL